MGETAGVVGYYIGAALTEASIKENQRMERKQDKIRDRQKDTLNRRRRKEKRAGEADRHRERVSTLRSDRRQNAGALVGGAGGYTSDSSSLLGG